MLHESKKVESVEVWLNLFKFRDLLRCGFQRYPKVPKSFPLETFRVNCVLGPKKRDCSGKKFQTSSLSRGRRER